MDALNKCPLDKQREIVGHESRIYRFALKILRHRETAEDITQQTMFDAIRTYHLFEHRSLLGTWLLSIARFKSITALNRRTFEDIEAHAESIADVGCDIEESIDQKQRMSQLWAAVAKLSPEHRNVITYYARGVEVEDIARLENIPVSTVKTRAFYAREAIRKMLRDISSESVKDSSQEVVATQSIEKNGGHVLIKPRDQSIETAHQNPNIKIAKIKVDFKKAEAVFGAWSAKLTRHQLSIIDQLLRTPELDLETFAKKDGVLWPLTASNTSELTRPGLYDDSAFESQIVGINRRFGRPVINYSNGVCSLVQKPAASLT